MELQNTFKEPIIISANSNLELGIIWNVSKGSPSTDLDLQAVLFDQLGVIKDACYHNNLVAANGSIKHSGDIREDSRAPQLNHTDFLIDSQHVVDGQELIWVDLQTLSPEIKIIVFVITASNQGGSFRNLDAAKAQLNIMLNPEGQKSLINITPIKGGGSNSALILSALIKQDTSWNFVQIDVATEGQNFQDCKEALRQEVDKYIDDALKGERILSMEATFIMKKDDKAKIPSCIRNLIVGLGWECGQNVDFDASIVCLDANKIKTDVVFYGKKQGEGITHRGDNTTGEGEGDDERIRIDLDLVPNNYTEMFVTVNIYSEGWTFKDVESAYVRICAAKDKEGFEPGHVLACYPLDSKVTSRGLIFCRLIRQNTNDWSIETLAWGCKGRNAIDFETISVCQRNQIPQYTPEKSVSATNQSVEKGCCLMF